MIELLFCVPTANGHVERPFSILKLIKSDRRSCLSENHLDDLMRISIDGPPMSEWNAGGAVQLWWTVKQRRVAGPSHPGTTSTVTQEVQPEPATEMLDFADWENFFEKCFCIHSSTDFLSYKHAQYFHYDLI